MFFSAGLCLNGYTLINGKYNYEFIYTNYSPGVNKRENKDSYTKSLWGQPAIVYDFNFRIAFKF